MNGYIYSLKDNVQAILYYESSLGCKVKVGKVKVIRKVFELFWQLQIN